MILVFPSNPRGELGFNSILRLAINERTFFDLTHRKKERYGRTGSLRLACSTRSDSSVATPYSVTANLLYIGKYHFILFHFISYSFQQQNSHYILDKIMLLSRATRLLAALLSLSTITISQAYLPSTSISSFHKIHKIHKSASRPASSSFLPSSATNTRTEDADAFSAFADSLDEEPPVFKETPWQAKLDDLLNPSTNLADRQILVSELLMSNADIQQSVMEALANRKVCIVLCCALCCMCVCAVLCSSSIDRRQLI